MNIKLTTTATVHANYSTDGDRITECGAGQKFGQRLVDTNAEITCKRCLKIVAELARRQAEVEQQKAAAARSVRIEPTPAQPVTEAAEIEDGARVELTVDCDVLPAGPWKAGARGTVIEGKKAARGFDYLVKLDGVERDAWLYGSEIRKVPAMPRYRLDSFDTRHYALDTATGANVYSANSRYAVQDAVDGLNDGRYSIRGGRLVALSAS